MPGPGKLFSLSIERDHEQIFDPLMFARLHICVRLLHLLAPHRAFYYPFSLSLLPCQQLSSVEEECTSLRREKGDMKKDLSRVLSERQMLSSLRSAIASAIEPSSAAFRPKLPRTALIESEPRQDTTKPEAAAAEAIIQKGLSPSAPSEIVIRT